LLRVIENSRSEGNLFQDFDVDILYYSQEQNKEFKNLKPILEFMEKKSAEFNLMYSTYVNSIIEHYLNKWKGIIALVFDALF